MRKIIQLAGIALGLGLMLVAPAGTARADTVYTFDTSACCSPPPFGTVTIHDEGGGLWTVTVNVDPNFLIGTGGGGGHHAFNFSLANLNADITLGAGMSTLGYSENASNGTGSFQNSPYGDFNYAIECSKNPGSGGCGSTLVFSINDASFIPDTAGTELFAADIFCTACTGTPTGAVAVGVPGPIAGAGLPGLIMACGGLLALARRRRKATA